MGQRGEDRRVQRTRQLLGDGLLALIAERGYEGLTVQDILDRANLGRATFYAHYRDKEDLLLDVFRRMDQLFAAEERRGAEADWSLFLFQHTASQRRLYQAMVGKPSGHLMLDHVQSLLAERVYSDLQRRTAMEVPGVPLDVAVQFVVSGLLGLLTWWLDRGCPEPPEQMNAMFKQLCGAARQ